MIKAPKPILFIKKVIGRIKSRSNNFIRAQDDKLEIYKDRAATLAPMFKSQFLGLVFLCGFSIIGLKLAYVSLLRPLDVARSSARAETQKSMGRAQITDRNGVLLATSLASYALYASPKEIWNAKETAIAIRTVFPELNEKDLIEKLSSKKTIVWIKRRLTPNQKNQIWQLAQPGLEFETESRRIYPNGTLAGHLLGGINAEGKGIIGIEKTFQDELLNNPNQAMRTSIDSRVQYMVEQELNEAASKFNAKSGVALVMDIKTGEMIAATSWPFLNPNNYGINNQDAQKNNFLSSVFEMGSTFKAFTFAVAINDNKINENTQFDVSRAIKFGSEQISDLHGGAKILSAREVLENSSNIGTVQISRQVGGARFQEFLGQLNLTKRVNGGLSGAAAPKLPNKWGSSELATVSFGHGIMVSPLAVIAAYGAITNGGNYVKPRFTALLPNETVLSTSVISPEASNSILKLLRDVVTNGTGKAADTKLFPIAGKTGTAEVADKNGYDKNRRISSFAGVFPADNPKYAILFLLNEPKAMNGNAATAAVVVAPSISKIVSRIAPILGIMPQVSIAASSTSAKEEVTHIITPEASMPSKIHAMGAR